MTGTEFAPLEDWVFSYLDHELRTPLNVMLGFSQMLRDGIYGEVNATQHDRLESIVRSTEQVLHRLDLLLTFNRLQQGFIDLTAEHFTLDRLLEEAMAGTRYDRSGQAFEVAYPDALPQYEIAASLPWASVALREVIRHAASEARPDRQVSLSTELRSDGTRLAVIVTYNAPPMDTWQEGLLFTIQNQTGIGLPLALELLSRMHGSIEYDSFGTRHVIATIFSLAGK